MVADIFTLIGNCSQCYPSIFDGPRKLTSIIQPALSAVAKFPVTFLLSSIGERRSVAEEERRKVATAEYAQLSSNKNNTSTNKANDYYTLE